ncbi:hypothetical protein VNO80_02766 [Phaseolus coccineus]|uniref:Uncharacterized protein n=1 Tax=Phaseolus coccineus TaxID=3886 RepID=A0AAN9RRK4_PHACN
MSHGVQQTLTNNKNDGAESRDDHEDRTLASNNGEAQIRLEKEILDRYLDVVLKGNRDGLKKLRLRIEDPPRRKHMVFLGGTSLTGLMKDVPGFWINRENYLEEGIACFSLESTSVPRD